jgi:oligopeptide transport system substrate-binding protein
MLICNPAAPTNVRTTNPVCPPLNRKTMHLRFKLMATAALTLALSAPLLAAVIPAGTQLHPTQTFTRGNGSEPESMDPAVAETVPANQILRDLFEGLTATTTEGKTVPGVAESWKQTNPTTWVFKLRSNAKFSNGAPITADDFVYGIRRFVDPKTASPYAATFGVFPAKRTGRGAGQEARDEFGRESTGQAHIGNQDGGPDCLHARTRE